MQITDLLKWNTYNVLESVKYKDQEADGNAILSSEVRTLCDNAWFLRKKNNSFTD